MIASLVNPSPRRVRRHRIVTLTGLFWAFSYALLSIRGALFFDDWTRLIDDNRLLTVSVGAAAFALVLKQLDARRRVRLVEVTSWILAATIAVFIVRSTIDQLTFDIPQGLGVSLLYSLSWSAYFGLWVMGSLAFAPSPPPAATTVQQAAPTAMDAPMRRDSLEQLIGALLDEASVLVEGDRKALIERVLAAGGYESAEGNRAENERARLAVRIAARLANQV